MLRIKKFLLVFCFASMIVVMLSGCNTDPSDEDTAFSLTDKGKDFLIQMCRLHDFDTQTTDWNQFWNDFLFYSYTDASSENAEVEQVYREDLGFEEAVVKVSLREAEAHAKLVLGIELPDIKPSFQDMKEGQTSFYYQDGYYYIGISDSLDYQYAYAEYTAYDEEDPYAIVKYNISFEGESNIGTVSFTISPEDNENGFIIRAKTTTLLK